MAVRDYGIFKPRAKGTKGRISLAETHVSDVVTGLTAFDAMKILFSLRNRYHAYIRKTHGSFVKQRLYATIFAQLRRKSVLAVIKEPVATREGMSLTRGQPVMVIEMAGDMGFAVWGGEDFPPRGVIVPQSALEFTVSDRRVLPR